MSDEEKKKKSEKSPAKKKSKAKSPPKKADDGWKEKEKMVLCDELSNTNYRRACLELEISRDADALKAKKSKSDEYGKTIFELASKLRQIDTGQYQRDLPLDGVITDEPKKKSKGEVVDEQAEAREHAEKENVESAEAGKSFLDSDSDAYEKLMRHLQTRLKMKSAATVVSVAYVLFGSRKARETSRAIGVLAHIESLGFVLKDGKNYRPTNSILPKKESDEKKGDDEMAAE